MVEEEKEGRKELAKNRGRGREKRKKKKLKEKLGVGVEKKNGSDAGYLPLSSPLANTSTSRH